MKKTLLFTAYLLITITCFSQDIISLKTGERREVNIVEVSPTLVRYRLFSEPNGRMYFVEKADISGIMYKNGKVETFDKPVEQMTDNSPKKNVNQPINSIKRDQENLETVNQVTNKTSNSETYSTERVDNKSQSNREIYNSSQEKSSKKVSRKNYQDVVYLKSGNVIRGSIVERNDDRSIKIETEDGSVFVFQMSDIDRINQDATKKNVNSVSSSKKNSDSSQEKKSKKVSRRGNQAVVYLKSGTVIQGSIIEEIDNKSIKIRTANGNEFFYLMNDIERISR